jgi:hypothetical protein
MTQLEPDRKTDHSFSEDTSIRITRKEESFSSIFLGLAHYVAGWGVIFGLILLVFGFFHNVQDYYKYYETGLIFPGSDGGWLYWAGYYLFRVGWLLPLQCYQLIDRLANSQGMSRFVQIVVITSPLLLIGLARVARRIRREAGIYRDNPIVAAHMLTARQYVVAVQLIILSLDISLFAQLYTSYRFLIALVMGIVVAGFASNVLSNHLPGNARQVEEKLALIYLMFGRSK